MNLTRDKNRAEAVVAKLFRFYTANFDWDGAASLLELERPVIVRLTRANTFRVVKGARHQSFPLGSVLWRPFSLYVPEACLSVRNLDVSSGILWSAIDSAYEVCLLKEFWPTTGKRFLLHMRNCSPVCLPNGSGGYVHVVRPVCGGADRLALYLSILAGVV